MSHFSLNKQIGLVSNFSDLINTSFQGEMNALCWERTLIGNFKEITDLLILEENITEISIEDLISLRLSDAGIQARDIIIRDIQLLTEFGASPSLNLLQCYERDDEFDFISTDVYSFHVDRSPIATDTYLCTYYGASSDIIANENVVQKILIPEIREKLKELHDGDESDFEQFLQEYYFDLHYQAQENAQITNLGVGHLWRLAVDHPEQAVLPCVHRAPFENDEYRLLLIC